MTDVRCHAVAIDWPNITSVLGHRPMYVYLLKLHLCSNLT